MNTNLQEAINYLGAKKVAEGDWAYFDDATGKVFITCEHDMQELGEELKAAKDDGQDSASSFGDVYSLWCTCTDGTEAGDEQIDIFRRGGI